MPRRMSPVPRRRPLPMRGSHLQVSWAREIYRRLLENHVRVRETCDVLALLTQDMSGPQLAEWYLDHLIRYQRRAEWWIVHRKELNAAWFVSSYVRAYLNTSPEDPLEHRIATEVFQEAMLCPEDPRYPGAVTLTTEANLENIRQGICALRYEAHPDFIDLMHSLNFVWNPLANCFERPVTESAEPLEERAAEFGSRLLLAGFRVIVMDEGIRARICSSDFGWEHDRWIDLSPRPSYLRLTFPQDRQLFQLARSMGAFWTGKRIEIGVWHAPALQEFARLYGFRITMAAARSMAEWQELYLRGKKVTPAQPPPPTPPDDPLQRILETDDGIPEDLIDED